VAISTGSAGTRGLTGPFRPVDRLLRSREFEYVLRHGRRATAAQFVVLTAPSQSSPPGRRLGITVSKRVGNAVVRNRVKRRVREWFRTRRHALETPTDLVVIGRRGAGALSAGEIASLLDAALSPALGKHS
jgi:ribonuclease P protein component